MDPRLLAGLFIVNCVIIMHGNLEPEERIMETNPRWDEGGTMDRIEDLIQKLGWKSADDIEVEIGGASTYEIDGAGTKWAPNKGTVKYNKDAFIVIKNRSRGK